MTVVECDVPAGGALGRELIERADFRDAYRVPLHRPDLGVVDIFFGVFAHRPVWMNLMLIARNKAAALAGLETPTTSEIVTFEKRARYAVGEKIGPWPIFFLGADELVAGRDNKHMDFRLLIRKVREDSGLSVVVHALHGPQRVRAALPDRRYSFSQVRPSQPNGARGRRTASLATFVPDPCRPVDVAARQVSRLLAA
jgi:hypothetical protein